MYRQDLSWRYIFAGGSNQATVTITVAKKTWTVGAPLSLGISSPSAGHIVTPGQVVHVTANLSDSDDWTLGLAHDSAMDTAAGITWEGASGNNTATRHPSTRRRPLRPRSGWTTAPPPPSPTAISRSLTKN